MIYGLGWRWNQINKTTTTATRQHLEIQILPSPFSGKLTSISGQDGQIVDRRPLKVERAIQANLARLRVQTEITILGAEQSVGQRVEWRLGRR